MTDTTDVLPHWDLSNVYPGLDSPEFVTSFQEAVGLIDALEAYLDRNQINRDSDHSSQDLSTLSSHLSALIEMLNSSFKLVHTLNNYVYCYITTDSYNSLAAQQYSKIQAQLVRLLQTEKVIAGWLGSLGARLDEIISNFPEIEAYAFYLSENAQQSQYLMRDSEEQLANQLSLSSIRAWGKLQGTVTSQLSIEFELDGEVSAYPLPGLQNIRRYSLNPEVRKRAFEAEIEALESVREPLAACMNGVTGYNIVLNQARNREDAIHHSLDTARIDRETLEAMMSAMQASFPVFRSYLHSKARRFDKRSLPWWDIFAPVGEYNRRFSWSEAREFVLDNFNQFSPELASFARRAFESTWIDAEPRAGKRGGAFCIRIPVVEEARVLCNFDGSLDQVSTIAHELGHAFHIDCQRGKDYLQYITPMTLAETASIFCETIIMDAVLENTTNPQEELSILETILVGDTQVIVDISSRYLFEKEVYKRRSESELSPDDFCEIISRAQMATYGDGLDENHLHPYMWAWKPHYYRSDIAFYNYPYAFGLLFSTGLYAIYKQRGPEFIPQLQDLLASTGLADAADLANRFDIDIRTADFWENSLQIIQKRIARYQEL
jgi:pepF/M3 family oligoendopeptidase